MNKQTTDKSEEETKHLLSSPANREHLEESMRQAAAGQVKEFKPRNFLNDEALHNDDGSTRRLHQ